MKRQRLTIEEAVGHIDQILDKAERLFHERHSRFPSLVEERDYVLLGEVLSIPKRAEIFFYEVPGKEYRNGRLADIAYRLMRRYLEREGFFSGDHQQTLFDAVLGRLEYNVPKREKEFRFKNIERLQGDGVDFPQDWKDFVETITKISGKFPTPGVCFLRETYKKDPEAYRIGFDNVGCDMVNPSGHARSLLEDVTSFEELTKAIDHRISDDEVDYYR